MGSSTPLRSSLAISKSAALRAADDDGAAVAGRLMPVAGRDGVTFADEGAFAALLLIGVFSLPLSAESVKSTNAGPFTIAECF